MKDICGYEGLYAITRDGRVWSYPKTRTGSRGGVSHNGIWLKPSMCRGGYLRALLSSHGRTKTASVARLVASAFIPNPSKLPEINHINGVKTDNRAENLEWVTRSQNQRHARLTGLHGERSLASSRENAKKAHLACRKISTEAANEARYLYASGQFTQKELSARFGISERIMFDVIKGHPRYRASESPKLRRELNLIAASSNERRKKLSDQDERAIQMLRSAKGHSYRAIGDAYGVTATTVMNILRRLAANQRADIAGGLDGVRAEMRGKK